MGGVFLNKYIMKVIHAFYCTHEKKNYKVGDVYTGKRKDLSPIYVKDTEKKERKPRVKKQEKK